MDEVTFNVKVTMSKRWQNEFLTFLKHLEENGNIGHSSIIGFYADGDGDFHPKFDFDVPDYEQTLPSSTNIYFNIDALYDAG